MVQPHKLYRLKKLVASRKEKDLVTLKRYSEHRSFSRDHNSFLSIKNAKILRKTIISTVKKHQKMYCILRV